MELAIEKDLQSNERLIISAYDDLFDRDCRKEQKDIYIENWSTTLCVRFIRLNMNLTKLLCITLQSHCLPLLQLPVLPLLLPLSFLPPVALPRLALP